MRTLAIMAAALGLVGTIAVSTAPPAAADWYYGHLLQLRWRNLERLPAWLDRTGRRL